jgi:hypothetical protein
MLGVEPICQGRARLDRAAISRSLTARRIRRRWLAMTVPSEATSGRRKPETGRRRSADCRALAGTGTAPAQVLPLRGRGRGACSLPSAAGGRPTAALAVDKRGDRPRRSPPEPSGRSVADLTSRNTGWAAAEGPWLCGSVRQRRLGCYRRHERLLRGMSVRLVVIAGSPAPAGRTPSNE